MASKYWPLGRETYNLLNGQYILAIDSPPNGQYVLAIKETTNIFNLTQKENVNLGWEKHIPNFTENGQK
jgi:hypothetical protein